MRMVLMVSQPVAQRFEAQSSRHNDEESSLRMVLMVRQAVAQRAKSTMLAIHPRMTIYTGELEIDKKIVGS